MSCTDLVIIADGSFDGSDATAGVGYQIFGQGFFFESGAAFDRQVCRSSVEAEVASMLRALVMAYRILAKNTDGYVASRVTVRCDCESAVRFMQGGKIKGMSSNMIRLRDRVRQWYLGENYELVIKHLKSPTARNLREITAAQCILMDVDKLAKTYAGYRRLSPKRVLMDDITFKEDWKLEIYRNDAAALKRIAIC